MKKVFVQYPSLRSSTRARRIGKRIIFRDPCTDERGKYLCENCRVFVSSDRFLGNETQLKYTGSLRKFPYVIIADTVGCNQRCWFCYSHQYWTLEKAEKTGCRPIFLSSEEVVNQIRCKIEKIKSLEGLMDRKPFMRIRISGGEPIYATSSILKPYDSDKKIDYKRGIDFWLEFFEKLDPVIHQLNNKKLFIINEDEWDKEKSLWPTFISDSPNRVNIRFDTNGIAFGDNKEAHDVLGGKEIADYFIEGIYKLHKDEKINSLKIWIDYSFKGATPNEYYWSQRKNLPTTQENNNEKYNIIDHPQYSGLKNLREKISEIRKIDPSFKHCLDITVERGIDHDLRNRIFIYNFKAFNWDILAKKANIKFSKVRNNICVVYSYSGGPWGLFKRGPLLIKRYFNQGAKLFLTSDKEQMTASENYYQAKQAVSFMADHNREDNYSAIITLSDVKIKDEEFKEIQKEVKKKSPLKKEVTGKVLAWILTGTERNWNVALKENIWGVAPELKDEWERLQKDDLLFFYVTKPISGIIGYGKAGEKFLGKEPLWPDEIDINKVKYNYRWNLEEIFVIPENKWQNKAVSLKGTNIIFYRGLNPILNKNNLDKLISIRENIKSNF